MKRIVTMICIIILAMTALASRAEAQTESGKSLMDAIEAISQTRVFIEFYFMEAGDYPESLEQLEADLNTLLPRNMENVKIPKDPATGSPFVYKMAPDRKSYSLKAPDPSRYGVPRLEFVQVPWGGFAEIAEERKQRFLQMISIENIKAIATAIEYYAKDHAGNFPAELKDLIPKYLNTMPVCPVTGDFYKYQQDKDKNYTIGAPKPSVYGLSEMFFSSQRGWVTK